MKKMGRLWVFFTILAFLIFGFGCATTTVEKQEGAAPETGAAVKAPATVEKKAEAVEAEKKAAEAAEAEKKAAEAAEAEKKAAEAAGEKKAPAKEVKVVTPQIRALESIHFDFDKYNIRPPDREILNRHAEWLKNNKDVKITIEGHCDERGTVEYNLALGERRANEAKKYLISLGVEADRIKTVSYGKERPIDPQHNEEAWAKNRRAEFVIESQP